MHQFVMMIERVRYTLIPAGNLTISWRKRMPLTAEVVVVGSCNEMSKPYQPRSLDYDSFALTMSLTFTYHT